MTGADGSPLAEAEESPLAGVVEDPQLRLNYWLWIRMVPRRADEGPLDVSDKIGLTGVETVSLTEAKYGPSSRA